MKYLSYVSENYVRKDMQWKYATLLVFLGRILSFSHKFDLAKILHIYEWHNQHDLCHTILWYQNNTDESIMHLI